MFKWLVTATVLVNVLAVLETISFVSNRKKRKMNKNHSDDLDDEHTNMEFSVDVLSWARRAGMQSKELHEQKIVTQTNTNFICVFLF